MARKKRTTQEWIEKINSQENSVKSAARWCKDNEEPYQTFLMWRKRLKEYPSANQDFLELSDASETWLDISFHGVKITIHKNFERKTLLFLLQFLGNFHA